MPFFSHPSINIFLLCPNMTRAVYFYVLDLKFSHMETRHSDTKHTTKLQPKHCLLYNRNSIFAMGILGEFGRLIPTESMGMGIYESKFVVLKHFGCDVSPKESSAAFLFTIYILKSVFSKDNSVEYWFD